MSFFPLFSQFFHWKTLFVFCNSSKFFVVLVGKQNNTSRNPNVSTIIYSSTFDFGFWFDSRDTRWVFFFFVFSISTQSNVDCAIWKKFHFNWNYIMWCCFNFRHDNFVCKKSHSDFFFFFCIFSQAFLNERKNKYLSIERIGYFIIESKSFSHKKKKKKKNKLKNKIIKF